MTNPFGLEEGNVTLPSIKANANKSSVGLMSSLSRQLGFRVNGESIGYENAKDSVSFELWCRQQGLLIEINDEDYAQPKLAVIG